MDRRLIAIQLSLCFHFVHTNVLFARLTEEVEFFWRLNPSPTASDLVWIVKQPANLFAILNGSLEIVSKSYTNRIHYHGLINGALNFTLRRVKFSDAGLYSVSFRSQTFHGKELVIRAKPNIPSVEEINHPVYNQTFVLNCAVKSNSVSKRHKIEMKYIWNVNRNKTIFDERYNSSDSRFVITSIQLKDSGDRIKCKAYEFGDLISEESEHYTIDVRYGPLDVNLTIKNTKLSIGSEYTVPDIVCLAECNPPCSFRWYKNGTNDVINRNLLSLGKVSKEKYGQYYCQVFNIYGNKSSSVIDIKETENVTDFEKSVFYGSSVMVIASTSVASVAIILSILLAICICYYKRKSRIRKRNRIALAIIRKRLADAKNNTRQRISDEYQHYQSITDLPFDTSFRARRISDHMVEQQFASSDDDDGSKQGNSTEEPYYSDHMMEKQFASSDDDDESMQGNSTEEPYYSSYEDLKIATMQPQYDILEGEVDHKASEKESSIIPSDTESNMADDEISLSVSENSDA